MPRSCLPPWEVTRQCLQGCALRPLSRMCHLGTVQHYLSAGSLETAGAEGCEEQVWGSVTFTVWMVAGRCAPWPGAVLQVTQEHRSC